MGDTPDHGSERWAVEDYEVLIDGMTEGEPLEVVAQQLGRTPRAVNKRLARMLGKDETNGLTPDEVTARARVLLRDPEFPWRDRVVVRGPDRPVPARNGAKWERSDHEDIIAGLAAGEDFEQIAARTQRKPSAVRQRVNKMLGTTRRLSEAETLEKARRDLTDPGFLWEENLRTRNPRQAWWHDALPALRQAWAEGRPSLTELETTYDIPEKNLASQLVKEGLAVSLREVAQRLGHSPDGNLASYLVDERPMPAAVVLTVTDVAGALRHTAMYTSMGAAEAAQRAYQAADTTPPRAAPRTAGGLPDAPQTGTAPTAQHTPVSTTRHTGPSRAPGALADPVRRSCRRGRRGPVTCARTSGEARDTHPLTWRVG